MDTACVETLIPIMISVAYETNFDHLFFWGDHYDPNQHSTPLDEPTGSSYCHCLDGPKYLGVLRPGGAG